MQLEQRPRVAAAEVPEVDEDEFDALHDVNTKGVLHCLQEEILAMRGQEPLFVHGRSGRRSVGPGSIITITSLAAVSPTAGTTTYVASKYAARGIVKTAGELVHDIVE